MAARSEVVSFPIMLVEDNPDDADLTIRALRKCGIENEVLQARDGVEALAMLGIQPESEGPQPMPAVVLLDLKMPRVDGFEVLRAIRQSERYRFLPVVILTSSDEDRDRAEAYSQGANSYVQKPIASEAFLEAVGRLGLYWLGVNRSLD
ncbi:response regulator [Natronospira bacteriovora]|uniref:Response regulator n=1 Tax=Natronospira bacteriovora TaxID=3069753 RepID=A0ABU0W6C5_9GAMM|nr:response regulator [Natronospira sp. AB-CW4]MDQ2069546.1 response regulator [Natronospira sp. AB-CW4]